VGASIVAIAVFCAIGCRSAGGASPGATAAGVGALTGAAAAVGAINMADHECFTVCPPGTGCDERTGLCERAHDDTPCGSLGCPKGKSCDSSGLVPMCVEQSSNHDVTPIVEHPYRPAGYPGTYFPVPPLEAPPFLH
jgi:hypothetical protein